MVGRGEIWWGVDEESFQTRIYPIGVSTGDISHQGMISTQTGQERERCENNSNRTAEPFEVVEDQPMGESRLFGYRECVESMRVMVA